MEHGTWRTLSCLSLGGIAISREKKLPPALENYLKQNSEVSDVYLHLDNDVAGRRAPVQISRILENKYNVVLEYPAFGKDVNDESQNGKKTEEKSEEIVIYSVSEIRKALEALSDERIIRILIEEKEDAR